MNAGLRPLAIAGVSLALLLSGCLGWPLRNSVPQPLPTQAGYAGTDGALLHVTGLDIGCCYIEGSLHFVQLEGPTSLTWQLNQRAVPDRSNDTFAFAERPIAIAPGSYTITFWQRPCDGSCDYLDPEVARCAAAFEVLTGEDRAVEARFPLQGQCSVTVSTTGLLTAGWGA